MIKSGLNRKGAAYNIRANIIRKIIDNDLNDLATIRNFVPYDDYYIQMALDYYLDSIYRIVISKNDNNIYYFYNMKFEEENVLLLNSNGEVLAKNKITTTESEILEDFGFKRK